MEEDFPELDETWPSLGSDSHLQKKIDKFLRDGGSKMNAIDILGTLFYWFIMLIVIMATLNSLNLTSATALFNEIMMYIPNIIVAIVYYLLGYIWPGWSLR